MPQSLLALPDPLVARYLKGELRDLACRVLSDEALYLDYCVRVELALLRALAARGVIDEAGLDGFEQACSSITAEEIEIEEERVRHDLKALVNCMVRRAPEELKPYVHLGATSYDILSNAHLMRLREGVRRVVLPSLNRVARELARLSEEEAATPTIGRTHGQYAEPTTFGYSMAVLLERLGTGIESLVRSLDGLRGKFSGAVGAYVSLGLLLDDPRAFEREVLALVDLEPNLTSTQITHPEPALATLHHVTACFGVLANLADDLRHLQRSEIAEVAERYRTESQVGSSAMPHKQNPITWENVKSLWKTFVPSIMTCYMDQISEHQRDLTNSASARFVPRLLLGLAVAAERTARGLEGLVVRREVMRERLASLDQVISGPAQVLLSSLELPEAHEVIRRLALEAKERGETLFTAISEDSRTSPYLERMSATQVEALRRPHLMAEQAKSAALEAARIWRSRLDLEIKKGPGE